VHADLGMGSPGYEWQGKSFIEACVAPADELIAQERSAAHVSPSTPGWLRVRRFSSNVGASLRS
jgi:hypothetical protein